MKIVKEIHRGQIIPAFYGIAWMEYTVDRYVCLPIPLNIIAAISRSVYIWLRHGYKPIAIDPRDAYNQGIKFGRNSSMNQLGGPQNERKES